MSIGDPLRLGGQGAGVDAPADLGEQRGGAGPAQGVDDPDIDVLQGLEGLVAKRRNSV